MTTLLLAAGAAGLVGSAHCVGMCGPLAAASAPGWHGGRLLAYVVAGGAAGGLGLILPGGGWVVGTLAAAVLAWSCLRFGGFIGGGGPVLPGLGRLARWASRLGRFAGFLLGALVVLLPCGLLWTALALAAASRDPAVGALVMAVHYVASFPALLLGGGLLRRLGARFRRPAALLLLLGGIAVIGLRAGAPGYVGGVCLSP